MLDGSQWLQWSPAFSGRVSFALTAAHTSTQYSLCSCGVASLLFALPFPVSTHPLDAG